MHTDCSVVSSVEERADKQAEVGVGGLDIFIAARMSGGSSAQGVARKGYEV